MRSTAAMVGPNPPMICNTAAIGCAKEMTCNLVRTARLIQAIPVMENVMIRKYFKGFLCIPLLYLHDLIYSLIELHSSVYITNTLNLQILCLEVVIVATLFHPSIVFVIVPFHDCPPVIPKQNISQPCTSVTFCVEMIQSICYHLVKSCSLSPVPVHLCSHKEENH